jgi:23S rRNA pseudouridine2605 synthase
MEQRLQKLISAAGIASRRHAEELIAKGEVSINGKTVTELGLKADPDRDHIKVKGRLINPLLSLHENTYVLLNKPRGYLTSMADPEGRPLVTDLLPSALGRLHPVGRLDFNSEGLLLLTNDGDFTNRITAAKNRVPKVYQVKVKGMPPEKAIERLRRGISIADDERTAQAEVRRLRTSKTNSWYEVILLEGRNQQIRRMFDAIGHSVIKLARTRIGPVEDKRLKPGRWRKLTAIEVGRLKNPKPERRDHVKERHGRPARRVARTRRASSSR